MASRGSALSLALALVAALALRAAAGEATYHASLDAAAEAAGKNRQLVMVVVVAPAQDKDGRDICQAFRQETLGEEQIARLVERHFAPFLLDIAAVREGKQAVPPAVQACFKQGEAIRIPQAIFLDAKCREVDRIVGYAPPQGYIGQLRKVVEKAVALIPEKDRREARRALERGRKALEAKDHAAAMEALRVAVALGGPGDDADAARGLMAQVEEVAEKPYLAAQDLEGQGKLGSAIRAYRECARGFRGTEAGSKAAARLAELRADPELRKRLAGFMGARLLAQARDALEQKRYAAAAAALDALLGRYAEAEQAAEARKLRDQLAADPAAALALRDAAAKGEAERLLSLGESFRRNGLPDKALAEYQKVLAKFPDTTFARTAAVRIADVRRELGQQP